VVIGLYVCGIYFYSTWKEMAATSKILWINVKKESQHIQDIETMEDFMKPLNNPVQDYLPSMSEIKAKWALQVGAAKHTWNQLTEKELLESEGHKVLLVDMIQERYFFTRDESNKQVNRFFEKHMSWRH